MNNADANGTRARDASCPKGKKMRLERVNVIDSFCLIDGGIGNARENRRYYFMYHRTFIVCETYLGLEDYGKLENQGEQRTF